MSHDTLDVRGQLCPIPVIRTQTRIATLQTGDTLEVMCSDPGALHDIPAWCRIHGHKILATTDSDHEIRITLEVHKPG